MEEEVEVEEEEEEEEVGLEDRPLAVLAQSYLEMPCVVPRRIVHRWQWAADR